MSLDIKHCGVVDEIEGDRVKVRIVQSSACASCKVASHCNASENKEKIVEVFVGDTSRYAVGDDVLVVASQRMGTFAVVLSSVVPLFIIVAVLACVLAVTGSEPVAALSSIAALAPYYLILYMCRDKIRARLSFKIEQSGS